MHNNQGSNGEERREVIDLTDVADSPPPEPRKREKRKIKKSKDNGRGGGALMSLFGKYDSEEEKEDQDYEPESVSEDNGPLEDENEDMQRAISESLQQREKDERKRLRDEQEQSYMESLAIDSLNKKRKTNQENKNNPIDLMDEEEPEVVPKLVTKELQKPLEPEPGDQEEGVVNICLKIQNVTLERRFRNTTLLRSIVDWVNYESEFFFRIYCPIFIFPRTFPKKRTMTSSNF